MVLSLMAIYTAVMNESAILSLIDEEIAKLQKVRSLLAASGGSDAFSSVLGRGRKKAAKSLVVSTTPAKRKRKLSAEGRARIAEAQKKRWAALKKKQAQAK